MSNIIRQLAVKLDNGLFSERYDIGAKATNVIMENRKNVEDKIKELEKQDSDIQTSINNINNRVDNLTVEDFNALEKDGDGSNLTVIVNEAGSRDNLENGDTLRTLFGKIKKWFADLKTVAFTGSYNDLSNKPSIPAAVAVKGDKETSFRTGNVNLTPANIGAAPEIHNHKNIISSYREDAMVTGTNIPNWPNGISMYEVYNNGYPTSYGNLINLNGNNGGLGQLLIGWNGNGGHAPIMVRSKRDVVTTAWSDWATVITSANIGSYTGNYLPLSGGNMTGGIRISGTQLSIGSGLCSQVDANNRSFIGSNGIAFSNPGIRSDQGWIRVTGTGESDTILEIATGDDGGGGEQIVVRQYNTSNGIARQAVLLDTSGNTSFPGTLMLTKTTDAAPASNNMPALIVGGNVNQQHLEFDGNEIVAKNSATTPGILYLNSDTGSTCEIYNLNVNGTLSIKYPNAIKARHIDGADGTELHLNYNNPNSHVYCYNEGTSGEVLHTGNFLKKFPPYSNFRPVLLYNRLGASSWASDSLGFYMENVQNSIPIVTGSNISNDPNGYIFIIRSILNINASTISPFFSIVHAHGFPSTDGSTYTMMGEICGGRGGYYRKIYILSKRISSNNYQFYLQSNGTGHNSSGTSANYCVPVQIWAMPFGQ